MSVRTHYILLLTSVNISSISGIIFVASYIYDVYYPVYFLFHISNTSKLYRVTYLAYYTKIHSTVYMYNFLRFSFHRYNEYIRNMSHFPDSRLSHLDNSPIIETSD